MSLLEFEGGAKEIAKTFQCSEAAANYALSQGRAKLKKEQREFELELKKDVELKKVDAQKEVELAKISAGTFLSYLDLRFKVW